MYPQMFPIKSMNQEFFEFLAHFGELLELECWKANILGNATERNPPKVGRTSSSFLISYLPTMSWVSGYGHILFCLSCEIHFTRNRYACYLLDPSGNRVGSE